MDVQHVQNTTMACANFSCATCSDCLCEFDLQNSFHKNVATSGVKWSDLNCVRPKKELHGRRVFCFGFVIMCTKAFDAI